MPTTDRHAAFPAPSPPAPLSPSRHANTGLLLTGGGARAAYQVGVLEAIADLRKTCGAGREHNPFPIITGTSAGAINAAALACGADHFERAVRRIARVWGQMHAHHIYGADSLSVMRSGARWITLLSVGWALARWRRMRPQSLLDNAPLEKLLGKMVPLVRLPYVMRQGHLKALAVTASSYSTGEHVTFYESGPDIQPWMRSQRKAASDRITHEHLLASSAIPFIFPAKGIAMGGRLQYFGDGSMRQSAPISPAIHLGAERIVVIGAGRMHEPQDHTALEASSTYPTLAQIAGHALSNIFLDALAVDVERVQRINQTLSLIPDELRARSSLKPVELLVIAPSQRLDTIAARHVASLPAPVRAMLGALGVSSNMADPRGAALASYLLFEKGYTQELMRMGYNDAMDRKDEICRFFGWTLPAGELAHLVHPSTLTATTGTEVASA